MISFSVRKYNGLILLMNLGSYFIPVIGPSLAEADILFLNWFIKTDCASSSRLCPVAKTVTFSS